MFLISLYGSNKLNHIIWKLFILGLRITYLKVRSTYIRSSLVSRSRATVCMGDRWITVSIKMAGISEVSEDSFVSEMLYSWGMPPNVVQTFKGKWNLQLVSYLTYVLTDDRFCHSGKETPVYIGGSAAADLLPASNMSEMSNESTTADPPACTGTGISRPLPQDHSSVHTLTISIYNPRTRRTVCLDLLWAMQIFTFYSHCKSSISLYP